MSSTDLEPNICDALSLNADGTPILGTPRAESEPFYPWLEKHITTCQFNVMGTANENKKMGVLNYFAQKLKENKLDAESWFNKLLKPGAKRSAYRKPTAKKSTEEKKLKETNQRLTSLARNWGITVDVLQHFLHEASPSFLGKLCKSPLLTYSWSTVEPALKDARNDRKTGAVSGKGLQSAVSWTPNDIERAMGKMKKEEAPAKELEEATVASVAELSGESEYHLVQTVQIPSREEASALHNEVIDIASSRSSSPGSEQMSPDFSQTDSAIHGQPLHQEIIFQPITPEAFETQQHSNCRQLRPEEACPVSPKRRRLASERIGQQLVVRLSEESRATLRPNKSFHKDVINSMLRTIAHLTGYQVTVVDSDDSGDGVLPEKFSQALIPIFIAEDHWVLGVISKSESNPPVLLYDPRPQIDAKMTRLEAYHKYLPKDHDIPRTSPLLHKRYGDSGVIVLAIAFHLAAGSEAPAVIDIPFWRALVFTLLLSDVPLCEMDMRTREELSIQLKSPVPTTEPLKLVTLKGITELWEQAYNQTRQRQREVRRSITKVATLMSGIERLRRQSFALDNEVIAQIRNLEKFFEDTARKLDEEIQEASNFVKTMMISSNS
ncbi:hypothetical protein AUP68_02519 [Ilyonectria robusta]